MHGVRPVALIALPALLLLMGCGGTTKTVTTVVKTSAQAQTTEAAPAAHWTGPQVERFEARCEASAGKGSCGCIAEHLETQGIEATYAVANYGQDFMLEAVEHC